MKPKTLALWIIAVIILCDGILHQSNFRPRHQYAPPAIEEIELPYIHITIHPHATPATKLRSATKP